MPARLTKNETTGRYELTLREPSPRFRNRCQAKGCGNRRPKERGICNKCKAMRWRANNPHADYLNNLRSSAARRGIPFNLTLSEFTEWADAHGLIHGRGRMALCLSVDRIRNDEGYSLDNIQVLTMQENCAKCNREGYTPFFASF